MRRCLIGDIAAPCRVDVVVTIVDVLLGALDEGTHVFGHANVENLTRIIAVRLADAATLTCAILECFGVAARATGHQFVHHPRLLLATLSPLLDRLGDDSEQVLAM